MKGRWLIAAALACELPETTLVGEHVRVAMDPGLAPCGDAVAHMDGFVATLAAEWGVAAPVGDDRIDFYWLQRADFTARTICINHGACSVLGSVYSTVLPADHELVHAVAHVFGTPPPFFIEGLAVAYETWAPGSMDDALPLHGSVRAAIDDRVDLWLPTGRYPLAGAFVAFLIERHGIDAVLGVYRELRLLDGRPRISRVFSRTLGESLEDAVAAFDATRDDRCPARAYRLKRFECSAPQLAWDGRRLREYRTLDRDQDDVLGPFHEDVVAVYRTLEIPVEAAYLIALIGDAGPGSSGRWNQLALVRCGGCAGYAEVELDGPATVSKILPAGRYALRITGPADAASGVGLRIDRLSPDAPVGP